MWNKDKVKHNKIKNIDDIFQASDELTAILERFDLTNTDLSTLKRLYNHGLIDEIEFLSYVEKYEDFESLREINDFKFKNSIISYHEYMLTDIEIDKDESLANGQQKVIGSGLSKENAIDIDPYVKTNIMCQYEKAIAKLNYRVGEIDHFDYELKIADINNDPYAKIVFVPDESGDSTKLSIDARFNDIFVEGLNKREEFTPKFDDEGRLEKDDLVEQWFHTAVIVLAANMLKESDLDIFRSVSSDNPGVPIIEKIYVGKCGFQRYNLPF
jgi:hypothetical protein